VTSQALPGGASTALAAEGALWVASYPGRSTLTKLEPSDLSTIDSSSPGELCCDLTFGDGALWAADPGGRVLRIQPATLVVADEYPVTLDRNAHTNLVYADGYVWVSSDSTDLMRLDPATGETTPFDVGGGVPFFARDGLVWGASTDEVWAVDSRTGEERQRVRLQDSIEVMALELDDSNMLWVGLRHPGRRGAVVRVDASTGAEFGEVPVDIPARIVLGFGSAWVTDSGSSLVYRLTS